MTSSDGADPKSRAVGESDVRSATRPRVLLADDYANILTALVRLISSSCDVVGTVTTGAQLLDAARRFAPDVIVVDLNLPDMSGLDACRQLKAASPQASGILLTAAAGASAADPCRLRADTDVAVAVSVTGAEGLLVAGVTLVVDHPEDAVGIPGEGIDVPRTTISDTPSGSVATANDLGGSVRVVLAQATALPLDRPLLKLHFQQCEGAKAHPTSDSVHERALSGGDLGSL